MAQDVVCLCNQFNIKRFLGAAFDAHPGYRLVNPDEIEDPSDIRHAIAFKPGPEAFAPFANLEIVCSPGAGVDALLHNPSLPDDVPVVRMINPEQAKMMAGFAAWHVIGHHRKLAAFPEFQEKHEWATHLSGAVPSTFPVAVLGYGAMGQAVGEALKNCGYPVTGWASRERKVDNVSVLAGKAGLAEVLSAARAVVCVLPLTDATRHILNARTFAMMRDDAILIQIGRGEHLNEAELVVALDAGRPERAALDVFETEPLPDDSPLWDHPRVFVTPHIASDANPPAIAASIVSSFEDQAVGRRQAGLVDRARGY